MTTYMPSITIPQAVFLNPYASVALPVALGTAVGYSTRRTCSLSIPQLKTNTLTLQTASDTQKMYMDMKQPPLRPPPWVFGPVWTILYGYIPSHQH